MDIVAEVGVMSNCGEVGRRRAAVAINRRKTVVGVSYGDHVGALDGALAPPCGLKEGSGDVAQKRNTKCDRLDTVPGGVACATVEEYGHEGGIGGAAEVSGGAYRALCEKLAVLHHREFGKFRRLKGRH